MTTLDELSKNMEAMSMSSILTDIATPPPPPPPLEIERWRTLSKSYRYDHLIIFELGSIKTSSYVLSTYYGIILFRFNSHLSTKINPNPNFIGKFFANKNKLDQILS